MLQTVTHAIEVLRALAERPEQSVSELATRLGFSRSTTHRILQTLAASRFLVHDGPSGRYDLGSEIMRLGRVAERRNPLYSKASSHLRALADRVRETPMLFIAREHAALIVFGVDGPQAMRYAVQVGDWVGLHAGAGSKALLAHLPESEIEAVLDAPLHRYTDDTVMDADQLRHELAEIRERGWSFSDGEVTPGTRSVGAPIYDVSGAVIASISVTSPAIRMADTEIERFAAVVVEATTRLSRELGWVRPNADIGRRKTP